MNKQKWKQVCAAARREAPPAPADGFAAKVLCAIRDGRVVAAPALDALNPWFARVAWAAAAIIVASLASDWVLTAAGVPGLGDGMSQLSAQWFWTSDGF